MPQPLPIDRAVAQLLEAYPAPDGIPADLYAAAMRQTHLAKRLALSIALQDLREAIRGCGRAFRRGWKEA